MNDNAIIYIGNLFTDRLRGKINDGKLCRELGLALSALNFQTGKKKFTVEITKNNSASEFFGMRVFPTIEVGDKFMQSITSGEIERYTDIVNRWKTLNDWVIELDSTLFDRNVINFTPDELTAMLIHEIGHVISSDRPIERFYRSYKEVQLRMKASDRATQKIMYMIYLVPLSVACSQRSWVNGRNQVTLETIADDTALQYGFGKDLVSALNKIIQHFGTINREENELQKEVDTSIDWCYRNIKDVMRRKEHLKDELYYQAIKTKSNYIKAVTIIVLDKVGIKLHERYNGYVVESTIEILNDPEFLKKYEPFIDLKENAKFSQAIEAQINMEETAMEGFFNKRKKVRVVLPSQYEIDAISVEVDNIRSHSDRIYVLDLIYEILEKINNFEEVISVDPALVRKWQGQINSMKDQLQMLRKATLEKKVLEKNYKYLVQLPPEAADYIG